MQAHSSQKSYNILILWFVLSLFALFFLLHWLRSINGTSSTWTTEIQSWSFILGILILSQIVLWLTAKEYLITAILVGSAALVTAILYALTRTTGTAWIALGCGYVLLLWMDAMLSSGQSWPVKLALHTFLAVWAGFIPVVLAQLEARFSEEEFYVFVNALILVIIWIAMAGMTGLGRRILRITLSSPIYKRSNFSFIVILALMSIGGIFATLWRYQNSFYPKQAPLYEGISRDNPFLCDQIAPNPQTYNGQAVFDKITELISANPQKKSPEYAYLALVTKNPQYLEQYKASILSEARENLYVQAANSIKAGQFEASKRIYFYSQIIQAFPGLFSSSEEQVIHQWFAAINRRAQTVEWVDWLYAVAFSKWPDGPYSNQEIGAGLLASLEAHGLSDPDLSQENKQYLAENTLGWIERFRNTDDAFFYQPVWIADAYLQTQNRNEYSNLYMKQSFMWLLSMALPDGNTLRFNHPSGYPLANPAYLGAILLNDDQFIWLSGRSTDFLASHSGHLEAYPGLEKSMDIPGSSPTVGSCLIYGDSGLPNQIGPLAPDKIVLRDGWSPDSTYLLLNLRFTGWHRYKATNTISLMYQSGPLLSEQLKGETFGWLPQGRVAFRDKRIPRENLNGLAIERTGLSKVINLLTMVGSPWAQDPPYYAQVDRFDTTPSEDIIQVSLNGWHGWQHTRTIHFYHQGPVVIQDIATGPHNVPSALFWHLTESHSVQGNRVNIRVGDSPAELVFVPLGANATQNDLHFDTENTTNLRVKYQPSKNGNLVLVTVLLTKSWVGASTNVIQTPNGTVIQITQGINSIDVPLGVDKITP